jgi:N-glycosylase/DNA lyase
VPPPSSLFTSFFLLQQQQQLFSPFASYISEQAVFSILQSSTDPLRFRSNCTAILSEQKYSRILTNACFSSTISNKWPESTEFHKTHLTEEALDSNKIINDHSSSSNSKQSQSLCRKQKTLIEENEKEREDFQHTHLCCSWILG